jgi:hypothetical protein
MRTGLSSDIAISLVIVLSNHFLNAHKNIVQNLHCLFVYSSLTRYPQHSTHHPCAPAISAKCTSHSSHSLCSAADMKSQLASSFTVLLTATSTARVINNGPVTPDSISPLNSRLLDNPTGPEDLSVNSSALTPVDSNAILTGVFDPNVWASQTLWDQYLEKGRRLSCLMQASDQGAGWLIQDTRQPPSAASRWTSNIVCKF